MRFNNLLGKKIGRLTVKKFLGKNKKGLFVWECECECGNVIIAPTRNLNREHIKSCGCLKKSYKHKHGLSKSKLYDCWIAMKSRCFNKNNPKYSSYGERGITVCNEWLNDFNCFSKWAFENGYQENLTIDRIDNNKGYEPSNCRWATNKEQCNNRRSNYLLTKDKETHTISEWSDIIGISAKTIQRRIANKMPIEKILYIGDMRNGK